MTTGAASTTAAIRVARPAPGARPEPRIDPLDGGKSEDQQGPAQRSKTGPGHGQARLTQPARGSQPSRGSPIQETDRPAAQRAGGDSHYRKVNRSS